MKFSASQSSESNIHPAANASQISVATAPTKALIITVVIAILLLAINMRAPIIGFGAVAKLVQQDLGLTTKTIGLIGTIPVMAFASSSFVAPMLSRRIGLENTMILATSLLAIGIFVRVAHPQLGFLLAGTVLLSLAISLGNVLIPAVIKKYTPNHIGLVMGSYSMFLSVFAGFASGIAMWLVSLSNWQFSLGVWGWVSVAAVAAWLIVAHLRLRQKISSHDAQVINQAVAEAGQPSRKSVWKIPMAWWISAFMGLQSLLYYTLASFLPSLLIDKGLSKAQAGNVGMVFQLVAFPSILLLTKWVSSQWNLRTLALLAAVGNLVGVFGFGFLPLQGWVWVWSIASGFGCGVIFTLCMMIFTLKSKDSQQAAELSGMAQTVGYSIAITGPIVTGWLKDLSYTWTLSMGFLTILMVINCVFSWLATQNKAIE
ncbi:MFS transporter [Moraxella osloensis]|uniref:MFS transporter n=1 Tax=Faucicola osloensis TaxID=34062 RepID=UPI0020057D8B|nr:MFS transporter [Moraxella osloensis]MCK6159469.1 MFS transporter [Moraxella osloensis]